MDVIYLAFSNSPTDPLPTLSREADLVHSILINRALRGDFFIHLDQHATIEKINRDLDRYRDRLAIFLYSGHAHRDSLLLDGKKAYAEGIALQLAESAKLGKLKLVVLNGCSTHGQVEDLKAAGVPAMVATSAPVEDRSATEFSIRFFSNICDKRMTISEAYEDALGPARTAGPAASRGLAHDPSTANRDTPLWECIGETAINPVPMRNASAGAADYSPNDNLTEALFQSLIKAENSQILDLQKKEQDGDYVEMGKKQTEIVNVLPNPIGVHLQKLLCPTEDEEEEGFDKVTLRRLEQAGWLYHSTVELLAWIMLSQLWELRLGGTAASIPETLLDTLRPFFYLSAKERRVFDYVPFIRAIRTYFDSLNEGTGIAYFVEELSHLKEVAGEDHPYAQACAYLHHLHKKAVQKEIPEAGVPELCAESESRLCTFFSELGFLHRYTLTSVKNIDIQQYRHERKARFNHLMVPLMRALGKLEEQKFLLEDFLDNRGVALIRWTRRAAVINQKNKQFGGGELKFLNLSPFLFDKFAFETADQANLLAFDQYQASSRTYRFKGVKRPDKEYDQVEVAGEGKFEVVFVQLEAFRSLILQEENLQNGQ